MNTRSHAPAEIWIPESLPCLLAGAMRARGLNRSSLAEAAGLRACRVSEYLTGVAVPGRDRLEVLCRALGLSPGEVARRTAWQPPAPGRPASASDSRLLGAFAPDDRYIPPRDRDFAFRMGAIRARYGGVLQRLSPRLVTRPDWTPVQHFLREAPADSGDEGILYFHALAGAFTTHWISPLRLAFEHLPVVDAVTAEPVGHRRRPVLGLERGSEAVVLVPHVGVRPGGVPYTIDFLAGVMEAGRRSWRVLEVDGEGHDPARDKERHQRIGLGEIRVVPEDLADPEFGSRLVDALLHLHRLEAVTRRPRVPCPCGTPRLVHLPEGFRFPPWRGRQDGGPGRAWPRGAA